MGESEEGRGRRGFVLFVLRRVTFYLWVPVSPRPRALEVAFPPSRGRGRGGGGWLSPLVLAALWGSPCVPPGPRAPPPRPAVTCSSRCRPAVPARRVRPPFGPLAWRPFPAVPSRCWSWPPAGPGGFVHPRGSPLEFLQEGSGGRCLGWDALRLRFRFCVGRSYSPPQCVSHPLLFVLHLARCLSMGSYSSELVTCRCLAPARDVGLSRFVSAWPCHVKPSSSNQKKKKTWRSTGRTPDADTVENRPGDPQAAHRATLGNPGQTGNATMTRNQLVEKSSDGNRTA